MDADFDIELLRRMAEQGRIHWHQHALERILERGIPLAEIVAAIMKGEIIDIYPTDRPYPSALILHIETEPVHVVAAADPVAKTGHVITAYRPDTEHFEPDFRTRRKES